MRPRRIFGPIPIACRFGLHVWALEPSYRRPERGPMMEVCTRCSKKQRARL